MDNRSRLKKNEAERIAEEFISRGYTAKIHGTSSVQVWKNESDWVCAFYWVAKKGWRLDVSQPILYSQEDLVTAIEEIEATQKAVKAVDEAWNEFNDTHNETNWRKYQGAQAAHQLRCYREPDQA
ncbi:MAG: hypothetical protein WC824_10775 [Bacteroidota bacterium]|jgi:hypothetical protein